MARQRNVEATPASAGENQIHAELKLFMRFKKQNLTMPYERESYSMLQKEMQRYNNEGNRSIQGGDAVLSIEHLPLSMKTANTLLFLLSTDDLFRDEFQKDPRAALASIGYITASDSNLPCLSVDVLASKLEFKDSAELLKRNLTPSAGLSIVFSYESGRIEQAISSSIVHQDSTPAQLLGRMPAPHESSSYLHVSPR